MGEMMKDGCCKDRSEGAGPGGEDSSLTTLRRTFGRFLERGIVEDFLKRRDIGSIINGSRCVVTCMFCDVCGFTALSERLPPTVLFRTLNTYFSEIIDVIIGHGGTIDKFVGDSIMVIFGAPVPRQDHALKAVRCAVEIQRKALSLQDSCSGDDPPMSLGIGINSGEVVAGCLGNSSRMDYTVLGDVINTAARLEGRTGPGQILIGPGTFSMVDGSCECRRLGPLLLKGKTSSTETYEVLYT